MLNAVLNSNATPNADRVARVTVDCDFPPRPYLGRLRAMKTELMRSSILVMLCCVRVETRVRPVEISGMGTAPVIRAGRGPRVRT